MYSWPSCIVVLESRDNIVVIHVNVELERKSIFQLYQLERVKEIMCIRLKVTFT